jgi:sodium pump decarboxylase gamma subunit
MIGESVSAGEALTVTVFSMGLVFLTLFAINLMLDFFGVQHKNSKAKKAKIEEQKQVEQKVTETTTNQNEDEELVAVITAALMQSLNTTADNLIIRRIRQIQDPTWAQTGRIENMN